MNQDSDERLARDAVARGCAALEAGDRAGAIPYLDRACRLAPGDPTAALLLAGADPARAEPVLDAALSHNPGHRAILAARAAAALRAGNPAQAAARLSAMLATGAPLPGEAFVELAEQIARESGVPGWIALSGDGMLHVSGRSVTLRLGESRLALAAGKALRRMPLPDGWERAATVRADARGTALIGSPIDIRALLLTEGCIAGQAGGRLTGWAWHPNDPDRPCALRLVDSTGAELARAIADLPETDPPAGNEAQPRPGFCFDLGGLSAQAAWPLHVRTPDGSTLPGGPVDAGEAEASRAAAAGLAQDPPSDPWRPIPAIPAATAPPPRPASGSSAAVIVAWDGDDAGLIACQASVAACDASLVVVRTRHGADSAGGFNRAESVSFIAAPDATGPALLNAGLRHVMQGRASLVLLLAHPVALPHGLTRRLAAALRAEAGAGLVQPLLAPAEHAAARDRVAKRCNRGWREALILADGPVLGLDMRCLRETGLLRDAAFATVPAALADFAARARHLGWRAILAGDCCVGMPQESQAPAVREALAARDRLTLERLSPGIGDIIAARQRADPGALARRRIAMAEWASGAVPGGSVVFVTHADGGGVERHVRQRAAAVQADGRRAIVIRPGEDGGAFWSLADGTGDVNPDLRFRAPEAFRDLADLLRADRPLRVELHHAESHDQAICGLAAALGIPYDVFVHDFAMICPRVTLIGGAGRYCGEPADVTECDDCVADHGVRIGVAGPVPVKVGGLRARTAALAAGARRIVAPSRDSARRMLRHWPGVPAPEVEPWEDDAALAQSVPRQPARPAGAGPVTVCVAGGIGLDKGFDVLLACARDAARRRLNLAFRVVGHTIDDGRLIDTGRVFITGRYEEHEAVGLIRAQHADIGFLPSVWPETWCYALSALWQAGLWTLAFAIGTQAERIAATGAGRTVPLGMPAGRLNDFVLGLFPAGANAHG